MKKLFISYSHDDVAKVKRFALLLSLHGFDLWMDEKNISSGDNYTTKILNGIHESDAYLVFLSESSIKSPWVNAEIDFALREKIERNRLTIIPVLLENVDIPVSISNIDYLDARFSMQEAVSEFADRFQKKEHPIEDLTVSSISFAISEDTSVQLGPFNESMTTSDLKANREHILQELRKKAYGILMNFVLIDDFDFSSDTPKFANGLYEEKVIKKSGSTNGSICENITVETVVFCPDMKKVNRLLNDRIEVLCISSICFGFSLPIKEGESILEKGKHCVQKLQDKYTILSYDNVEGAKIELSEDFFLCLAISEDIIKVKLSTKYGWQFDRKFKDFSVFEFIRGLLS